MQISNYILIPPIPTDPITPLIEPITLDEVKQRLRLVGNSDFDAELTRFIVVAREMCENITGRDLINKTYRGFLDSYCQVAEFRKSRLQSISSVKYYKDDVLTTFTDYYSTNEYDYSKLIFKSSFTPDDRLQAIEIEFVAGYGATASSVPTTLKEGMLAMVDWLFNNSGDCTTEASLMANTLFNSYVIGKKIFFTI